MLQRKAKSILVKSSLSDQLIKIILDKITFMNYPPGSRIDIEELKREFGISHIPIRDALHKLSEQGLVKIIPRVGYFTVEFSREELEDLFEVRILLELSSLAKGIKRIDKKLLDSLRSEYIGLKNNLHVRTIDVEHFFELSEILHKEVIIKCSDSPLIEKIYQGLINKIRISSRLVYLPDEDINEHLSIIESLIQNDLVSAKKLLRSHLIAVKNRALTEILQNPDAAVASVQQF
jgi:DNA-binding GntR family transcriptional regulator